MKKYNFIDKHGNLLEMDTLQELEFNKLGVKHFNWEKLNHITPKYPFSKTEAEFSKKWGLYPSVWNVGVFQALGVVYLYEKDYLRIKVLKGGDKQK